MRCANSPVTTGAARRVLPWRVRFSFILSRRLSAVSNVISYVSLSAEDKQPDYLIYRPPVMEAAPPLDHDLSPTDSEEDDHDHDHDHDLIEEHHPAEDDHHGWLGGMTATTITSPLTSLSGTLIHE